MAILLSIQKMLSLVLVFITLISTSLTGVNKDSDLETIRNNITQGLAIGKISPFVFSDKHEPSDIIALCAQDGNGGYYFTDIDYSDPDRVSWPAACHVGRAERLAICWASETDYDNKEELLKYTKGLIDNWIREDYQNPNWWHNQLSIPNAMGEIGVLLKDELSFEQLVGLAEIVGRGAYTVSVFAIFRTGANATDLVMATIKYAVITGNRIAMKAAVKRAEQELRYSSYWEGIKKDGTFFQHGERIYTSGYGNVFLSGISNIMLLLSGTKYMFPESKLEPVSHMILEGMRPLSYGNTIDPITLGRAVSRRDARPLLSILPVLRHLASIPEMPRREEIADYITLIENNTKTDNGLRYYEDAKLTVINNSDFYFRFHGGSNRMLYSEIINNENVLSYNSSFPGTTAIMHTGQEYYNISPVLDYSLIPGTTAVYETDEELRAHRDFSNRRLLGIYGSEVDDKACISFVKTRHEGISMTLTCFATDNAAVILGAGLKDSAGRAMNTTINQSFYKGSFTRNGNIVIHNGIKYNLIDGGTLVAEPRHRTGSWSRNNLTLSSEPIEGDLFTVYFENTGSYAYSVMAENTSAEFTVIKNDETVQAVKLPEGRIAAAFFKNGSFSFDGTEYSGKAGNAYFF